MQAACDEIPGTMAAVLGLEDQVIEGLRKNRGHSGCCQLQLSGSIGYFWEKNKR